MLRPQVITATELSYDLVVPSASSSPAETATADPTPAEPTRPASTQPEWLKPYLPYLVATWFIGVLSLTVRLLGGLWLLRKLKTRFNQPVSEMLALKCLALAQRLGIARVVRFRGSLSVNVRLAAPDDPLADERHQRS